MRWIATALLIVLFGAIAVAVKSGLEADQHISRCLDESSPSFITDRDERLAACN